MVSQDKLIKQGIYLTDNVFDEILKRLSRGIRASDTLEAFITRTKDYTMNNPLVVNGFKDDMLDIILRETNNHKFGRPAQKELVRLTIENRVGDLIVDVGDDIRNSVRDIVKHGYNNNLSQDEIAKEITKKVTTIKNTRAALIARTEIARTATASDYVINKERGATHFVVDCRNTCCDVCRKDYNFGVVEYNIDQVEMLPPRHPRCRCYAMFFKKDGAVNITSKKPVSTTQTITDESKTLIPPKVTKKLDNFGKEYGNSSKEHMQFFTENNSSEASHGSTGTVSKSGKQIQFLQQETEKGNVIHGTHTHPNDHEHYTMLSHEDVVDVFMILNNDGINLGSFSAENKRNRITVVKLPNYNQYTEYSERSGVKVDLRMAVNGAFATHVEDYRNVRGSSSGGKLQFLREKRAELKEKYPGIKGYELMEKMKHYEEEASKIDWEKDHRKKIDNAYKEMIKNVNKDLERFGIRFEVEYKD